MALNRVIFLLWLGVSSIQLLAAPLVVATYNLEFYIDAPVFDVSPKSPEARWLVQEAIKRINPDVIALQEVGSRSAFAELSASLKKRGLYFSHSEYIQSADPHLHLAFLSRFPISASRHHTNENYLYQGKRFHVARGFAEIDVKVGDTSVTLLTAHLKSRRLLVNADQQGLREEEAVLLRERIDDFFRRQPKGNLIVLGDLNDHIGSRTLRTIIGRGRTRLFDPRIAEANGDSMPNPNSRFEPRRIVWTHYYAKEEMYSRADYILLSPNLRDSVNEKGTYVLAMPDWGTASDHRPVRLQLDLN